MFRIEQTAARRTALYRLTDVDLASRLSFFLWGTLPDEELLKAATDGTLRNPAVFDKQVKRMLADPRSRALSTRFASQWLRLQDVDKVRPDGLLFPHWDASLIRGVRPRNRALLRQHRPREPQRARSDQRRLHVRERAAGAALRHPERHRSRVPARAAARAAPRPADAGQHPAAHVGGRSHVAGAARQVGAAGAARLAAAAAAAERAGVRGHQAARRTAVSCRCASAWSSTARIRRACRAIA